MRDATLKVQRQKEKEHRGEGGPGYSSAPQHTDEQNEAVEEYSEQLAEPPYAGGCSEDDGEEDYIKTKVPQLQPPVEQELTEFYEVNFICYDKSRSDYKNSKKRLLQEQAATLNLTGECRKILT